MSKENTGDNWPRLNRWSRVGSPLGHRLQGRQWRVYLGNCPWNPRPLINDFLTAWHCWFLPYGFNHLRCVCITSTWGASC